MRTKGTRLSSTPIPPRRLDAPGKPNLVNIVLAISGNTPPNIFLEKDCAASTEDA